MTAMMIAMPMSAVLAMRNGGMMPVRFSPSVRKKIVIRIGMNRLPSFSPSVLMTMLLRTNPSTDSRAACPRPGTTFIRRVPSTRMSTSTATTSRRMSMTRLSSNGVPAKRTAPGKNSSIEGPWNPPSSSSAVKTRVTSVRAALIGALLHRGVGTRGDQGDVASPYQGFKRRFPGST